MIHTVKHGTEGINTNSSVNEMSIEEETSWYKKTNPEESKHYKGVLHFLQQLQHYQR